MVCSPIADPRRGTKCDNDLFASLPFCRSATAGGEQRSTPLKTNQDAERQEDFSFKVGSCGISQGLSFIEDACSEEIVHDLWVVMELRIAATEPTSVVGVDHRVYLMLNPAQLLIA